MPPLKTGDTDDAPADENSQSESSLPEVANHDKEDKEMLPPWHPSNSMHELHKYPLDSLKARSWINFKTDYGSAFPVVLMAMLIGLQNVGDSEST